MRNALSAAAGSLLATLTRLVAMRPAAKPLHPRGVVRPGRLERHGALALHGVGSTGVPWLDTPGANEVQVRISRAIGLPSGWPDIHGMAVRVPGPDGPGDLLLASTGWGPVSRFVLTVHRKLRDQPLTSLLPYRSPTGPLLLAARAAGEESHTLFWARPRGRWHEFATLTLGSGPGAVEGDPEDRDVAFDPVRNQLEGLQQYPWVARLRAPAYVTARKTRT